MASHSFRIEMHELADVILGRKRITNIPADARIDWIRVCAGPRIAMTVSHYTFPDAGKTVRRVELEDVSSAEIVTVEDVRRAVAQSLPLSPFTGSPAEIAIKISDEAPRNINGRSYAKPTTVVSFDEVLGTKCPDCNENGWYVSTIDRVRCETCNPETHPVDNIEAMVRLHHLAEEAGMVATIRRGESDADADHSVLLHLPNGRLVQSVGRTTREKAVRDMIEVLEALEGVWGAR